MHIPFISKFPVDAVVLQKRGNSLMAYLDKARFIKRKGTEYYELKKRKTKFRPSTFDNMIPQPNGRPLVILYEYQRDMLVPVDTTNLEIIYERDENGEIVYEKKKMEDGTIQDIPKIKRVINLKAIDESMAFWGQQFRREAEERHKNKSFMEKYWPFIMMGMVFVFYVILAYFFMQAISDTGHGIIDVYQKFLNQATKPPG